MPYIYTPAGHVTRYVKNLRWLRDHAADVETVRLIDMSTEYPPSLWLVAELYDGRVYQASCASVGVMRRWVHRSRSLRGVRFVDCGQETTAGQPVKPVKEAA